VSTLNGRVAKLERGPRASRCQGCGLRHQREYPAVEALLDAMDAGGVCVVNTTCRTCPTCLAFVSLMVLHQEAVRRRLPDDLWAPGSDGEARAS
jgi:hypothetical protein